MKGEEHEQAISNLLFPPGLVPPRRQFIPHLCFDFPNQQKGI